MPLRGMSPPPVVSVGSRLGGIAPAEAALIGIAPAEAALSIGERSAAHNETVMRTPEKTYSFSPNLSPRKGVLYPRKP